MEPRQMKHFHGGEDSSRAPIPTVRRARVTSHGCPNRWYPTTSPHGITTQKTANWKFLIMFTVARHNT